MKDLGNNYIPVAAYLKRMAKEGIDDEGEIFLEVLKNFLNNDLSPNDFIEIWQGMEKKNNISNRQAKL